MNIIFFVSRVIYGGGEKVRNWLANQLINSGHSVIYAVPIISNQLISDLERVGLKNRINVIGYPFFIKRKKPISYARAIRKIYADNKIDLLIYFGGSMVEQLVARKMGVKILLSERCDPHSRSLGSQVLKQIQYRIADGYVFQTSEASLCYGLRVNKLSTIIPNPILDNSPEPKYLNLRKEIVSVGRLSKEKNQLMLLEAFHKIHNYIPDYKLIIYGSGPLDSLLDKYIKSHNMESKVHIIKGETNITELINGASLFVLPSNTEGMPNALIEAMSMGVLCISTDCPIYGPRFLVKQGVNAFLTPINDSSKLAKNILMALNHPNADIIRHEAFKIRETLNAEKISARWIQYIKTIVNQ